MGRFCKKVERFLNAGCIVYSISIFYFTFYLFGGAYAPNAPPLPTGLTAACYECLLMAVVVGFPCDVIS